MRLKIISIFILFATVYVSGCATYTYAPFTSIREPEPGADMTAWLMYHREQFRAYGDSTLQPRIDAPEAARRGYTQARAEWEDNQARTEGVAAAVGLSLGLGAAAAIIYATSR